MFLAPLIAESPNVTIPYANVYRLLWKKTNLAGNLAKVFVALEWRIKHSRRVGQDEKEIVVGKNIRSRTRRDVTFNWKAEVKDYGSIRALDLIDLFPNTIYKVSIKEGLEVKGELIWSGETSAEIVTPEGGKIMSRLNYYMNLFSLILLLRFFPPNNYFILLYFSIFARLAINKTFLGIYFGVEKHACNSSQIQFETSAFLLNLIISIAQKSI